MEQLFDAYIMVDWSGKDEPGPQHKKDDRLKKDNIWIGEGRKVKGAWTATETYCRTRQRARAHLEERLVELAEAGLRVLVGFDFALGYPVGFAQLLTGQPGWEGVWKYLAEHLQDDELNENNRFDLAAAINARIKGEGPFWGTTKDLDIEHLTAKSPWKGVNELQFGETTVQRLRQTDAETKGVQEVWKLYGAGSVGSQALTGIPVVWKLRQHPKLKAASRIWPFEISMTRKEDHAMKPKIVFAEIFPGVVNKEVRELSRADENKDAPKDQLQVRALIEKLQATDAAGKLFHWFFAATAIPEAARMEEAAILQPHPELEGDEPKKEVANSKSPKKDREAVKAEREAERERRKAEREAAKQEREAARQAAKAEREAARARKKAEKEADKKESAAALKEDKAEKKPKAKKSKKKKEAKKGKSKKKSAEPFSNDGDLDGEAKKIRDAKPDGVNIVEAKIGDPSHHSPDLDVMDQLRKKDQESE